jgi:hypothetical protein
MILAEKKKKITVIIGLIFWLLLGLMISLFIGTFYGFRFFINNSRDIEGRFLKYDNNKKYVRNKYSNKNAILTLLLSIPVVLVCIPFLTIFVYIAIIMALINQMNPVQPLKENVILENMFNKKKPINKNIRKIYTESLTSSIDDENFLQIRNTLKGRFDSPTSVTIERREKVQSGILNSQINLIHSIDES